MKPFQSGLSNRLFQRCIFKLDNLSAGSTNHVMVGFIIVRAFVLRSVTELMFDNQPCIYQQNDGIIESGTAHTELFLFSHIGIQHINIEMSLDGIDGIEYSVSFGCLPMPVFLKIISQNLLYLISNCFFHPINRSGFKVSFFYAIRKRYTEIFLLSGIC